MSQCERQRYRYLCIDTVVVAVTNVTATTHAHPVPETILRSDSEVWQRHVIHPKPPEQKKICENVYSSADEDQISAPTERS